MFSLFGGQKKKESDIIIIKKSVNKKYNIELTSKEINNILEVLNKHISDENFNAEKNKHIIKIQNKLCKFK